jgi:hypothetical protein
MTDNNYNQILIQSQIIIPNLEQYYERKECADNFNEEFKINGINWTAEYKHKDSTIVFFPNFDKYFDLFASIGLDGITLQTADGEFNKSNFLFNKSNFIVLDGLVNTMINPNQKQIDFRLDLHDAGYVPEKLNNSKLQKKVLFYSQVLNELKFAETLYKTTLR